jgi:hypothetical protein
VQTAPHHADSAELFYMLDGTAQLLSGEQVVTAERGDLVVVPPGLAHAFAAAPGEDADILIVITPASNGSSTSAIWSASPTGRCRPTFSTARFGTTSGPKATGYAPATGPSIVPSTIISRSAQLDDLNRSRGRCTAEPTSTSYRRRVLLNS